MIISIYFILFVGLLVLMVWVFEQLYKVLKNYIRLKKVSASIPGENGLPLIGQLLRFKNIDDIIDIAYTDFKKFKSPSKAFLGPVLLVCISEPTQIQTVLNSLHTTEKAFQYKFADEFFHEGLITASNKRWKVTRKLLNPAFNQKILQNYSYIFLEQSNVLVQKLLKEPNKNHFDITQYVTRNVIDSVSQSLLEYNINNEDMKTDFFSILERFVQGTLHRAFNPFLYPDFIYNRTKFKQEFNEVGTQMHTYLSQILKCKQEEITENNSTEFIERNGFLKKLLEVSQSNDIYNEKQQLGEILTMFAAGTDTTSVAICFILVMLGIHKGVQERVYSEIIETIGDPNTPITYENIQRMFYLERVVKEVLRLYPPVPFFVRDVAEDLTIGKHTLPRGATCIIAPFVLHRNPDVWPDPEKFNPDRFLPESVENRHPYSYIVFSGGSRNCIGKGYALLYIKCIIATILQTFYITCDLREDDFKLRLDVVLKLIGGFNISIRERRI